MPSSHETVRPKTALGSVILALILSLPSQGLRADSAAWWDQRWPFRRAVLVSPPQTHLEGADAAWVEFLTHGAVKPGGADIRVMTSTGKLVDHFVMQTGPDDRARVCFALVGRGNRYFIYYGNPEAQKQPAPDTWRPKRGVLLEGWTYRGGSIDSFKLTEQTFQKAGEPNGRTFVPNVFIGLDPFGPPSHYCHKYTGWLICPAAGRYAFTTTSKDASFLLLDDKEVVSWPGRHGPVHDARYTGAIQLDQGLHKLTYYHVSIGPDGRAVAAWQPPGGPRPVVIPPDAFAPIARGTCGDLDRYGRAQADFSVEGPGETFFENRYTFRYLFKGRLEGASAAKASFEWDFGDGVKAQGQDVQHVYLTPGMRTVTLTAKRGGISSTISNRLAVTRDWNRVTEPKIEPLEMHAKIVSTYDFPNLSPAELASALWLLKRGQQTKACLAAIDALPSRMNDLADRGAAETLPDVYALLVSDLNQPRRAAHLFDQIAAAASQMRVKAAAAVLAGRAYLDELGDLKQAEDRFERVIREFGDRTRAPEIRRARIGLGDVYLRTGRYRQAKSAYEQAGVLGDAAKRGIRVGSYAQAVEDYVRRKEFESAAEWLDRWEWEYPLEKLRGYSTLLKARLYERRQKYAHVTRIIEHFPMVVVEGAKPTDPVDVIYLSVDPAKLPELYKIDPATGRIQSASGAAFPPNVYGMEMGLLAADAHAALNQKDQARRVLQVLIQLYPDSPLLGEAKDRLRRLGGQTPAVPGK
ncbi:MAG: tetratricopeptide repeat protein [Phycisphaerae bacterium]|nr:tetratricopeptide repeat protein [Phycisphaerae bacterium]